MVQPTVKLETANWEITAIALRCDYIGDFVTVRVNRDWLAKCAWYLKYKLNEKKENKPKIDKTIKGRIDKCVGPDCLIVTKYRDQLVEEDLGRK
jgi:hypothetical protein